MAFDKSPSDVHTKTNSEREPALPLYPKIRTAVTKHAVAMGIPRLLWLIVLCVLHTVVAGQTQPSPSPSASPTPSPRPSVSPSPSATPAPQTWKIGFSTLTTDSVSDGYAFLAVAIPRSWRETMASGLRHRISADEAIELQREVDRTNWITALREINTILDERDREWFSKGEITEARQKSFEERLAKAREKRALYAEFDLRPGGTDDGRKDEGIAALPPGGSTVTGQPLERPAPVWVHGRFAVLDLATGAEKSEVLPAVDPDDFSAMRRTASQHKLRALVGGRLREAGGYLFLETFVFDAISGNIRYSDSAVFSPSDAEDRAALFSEPIAEALTGYKGGIIVSEPVQDNVQSTLYGPVAAPVTARDGGTGPRTWRFLEPGRYRLDWNIVGGQSGSEWIDLDEGGVEKRSPHFTEQESARISVESIPPGAEVYVQSQLVGITPLEVAIPGGASMVLLEMDGFRRSTVLADTAIQDKVSVTMDRDFINWDTEVRLRRNSFYDGLALFALSLTAPIVFDGLYRNVAGALPPEYPGESVMDLETYNRLANEGNLYYFSGIGTLLVSVVAFIDAAIKLDAYLRAADFLSGRR